jgi:hypothetical protein
MLLLRRKKSQRRKSHLSMAANVQHYYICVRREVFGTNKNRILSIICASDFVGQRKDFLLRLEENNKLYNSRGYHYMEAHYSCMKKVYGFIPSSCEHTDWPEKYIEPFGGEQK